MGGVEVPSAYRSGYGKALALNPDLAAAYVENTVVADPLADAVISAMEGLNGEDISRFMNAGMEQDAKGLAAAPQAFRNLFDTLEAAPAWYDRNAVLVGRRAFHDHLDLFIIGFIVITLRNFNSLMSRVFFLTGQETTNQGLRLIRNNIRYLTETLMLPGALDREGNGWRFSVRIRLVHARIRRQLRRSGHWDEAVYGVPISAANMGLTSANFSASLISDVKRLGADLSPDACTGLMQIWRYASWLIGTPESLLFAGNESETAELARIGHLCEPPPDRVSTVITNATVRAMPAVAGLTDPAAGRALVEHGYRVSRALLGDELADQYGFPQHRTVGLLARMRHTYRLRRSCGRILPGLARVWKDDPFVQLLDAAMVDSLRSRFPQEMEAAMAGTAIPGTA